MCVCEVGKQWELGNNIDGQIKIIYLMHSNIGQLDSFLVLLARSLCLILFLTDSIKVG